MMALIAQKVHITKYNKPRFGRFLNKYDVLHYDYVESLFPSLHRNPVIMSTLGCISILPVRNMSDPEQISKCGFLLLIEKKYCCLAIS